MKFTPTMVGVLAFDKAYTKILQDSEHKYHNELATLNGTQVPIMIPAQPAVARRNIMVAINVPCEMTISIQHVTEMRSIQDIQAEAAIKAQGTLVAVDLLDESLKIYNEAIKAQPTLEQWLAEPVDGFSCREDVLAYYYAESGMDREWDFDVEEENQRAYDRAHTELIRA